MAALRRKQIPMNKNPDQPLSGAIPTSVTSQASEHHAGVKSDSPDAQRRTRREPLRLPSREVGARRGR